MKFKPYALTLIAVSFFPSTLSDVLPTTKSYSVMDPDGQEIRGVTLQGTSMSSWEESADGYTIMDDKNGFKVYADKDTNGLLVSTDLKVNGNIAMLDMLKTGRHINPDFQAVQALKRGNEKQPDNDHDEGLVHTSMLKTTEDTITVKNLVVSIRFNNHQDRQLPSESDLEVLFNSDTPDSLAPTGSVKEAFKVSSFGKLNLESTILPIYTVSGTEQFYADGNRGFTGKFWDAIKEALDEADKTINFSEYDEDNDNYIDAITILHSGYGAEWGGSDCSNSAATTYNRIWSHKWQMSPSWVSDEGVRVYTYHTSPLLWGTCGSSIGRIGVIAHETGHFFGLPDLYDTNGGGSGIGSYGLMANSWGFDGSQHHPPIMSPWSKNELNWLNCPIIDTSGTYTLKRASEFNECYKIIFGFPSGEYLYIENRNKHSFDYLPQDGLVIYHIDEAASHNSEGHPGQSDWPANGLHYKAPVLQADGDYQLEKRQNRGDGGDVFHEAGVDELLPSDNPLTGPFPNTDSYKSGAVAKTDIRITNISEAGASMTFEVTLGNSLPPPTPSPTASPIPPPTASPISPPTPSPITPPTPSPILPPTPSPISSPVAQVGNCRKWCVNHPSPWEKKCNWRKHCAGCPKCSDSPVAPPPTKSPATPQSCALFCAGYPKEWWKKCTWNQCGACDECDTISTSSEHWTVAYHVNDHAEGNIFETYALGKADFDNRNGGPWATRLYDPALNILSQYGGMSAENWKMLDDWAEANQSDGDNAVAI